MHIISYTKNLVCLIVLLLIVSHTIAADETVKWTRPMRAPDWWISFADWAKKPENFGDWVIGTSTKCRDENQAREEARTNALLMAYGDTKSLKGIEERLSYLRVLEDNQGQTLYEISILFKLPTPPEKEQYDKIVAQAKEYRTQNKLLEAKIYYTLAGDIIKQHPDLKRPSFLEEIALIDREIAPYNDLITEAKVFIKESKTEEAHLRFEKALDYAKKFDVPEWLIECELGLASTAPKMGSLRLNIKDIDEKSIESLGISFRPAQKEGKYRYVNTIPPGQGLPFPANVYDFKITETQSRQTNEFPNVVIEDQKETLLTFIIDRGAIRFKSDDEKTFSPFQVGWALSPNKDYAIITGIKEGESFVRSPGTYNFRIKPASSLYYPIEEQNIQVISGEIHDLHLSFKRNFLGILYYLSGLAADKKTGWYIPNIIITFLFLVAALVLLIFWILKWLFGSKKPERPKQTNADKVKEWGKDHDKIGLKLTAPLMPIPLTETNPSHRYFRFPLYAVPGSGILKFSMVAILFSKALGNALIVQQTIGANIPFFLLLIFFLVIFAHELKIERKLKIKAETEPHLSPIGFVMPEGVSGLLTTKDGEKEPLKPGHLINDFHEAILIKKNVNKLEMEIRNLFSKDNNPISVWLKIDLVLRDESVQINGVNFIKTMMEQQGEWSLRKYNFTHGLSPHLKDELAKIINRYNREELISNSPTIKEEFTKALSRCCQGAFNVEVLNMSIYK